MTSSERRKYGREVEKINRRLEDKFLPSVRKAIKWRVDTVVNALNEGGTQAALQVLTLATGNARLGSAIDSLYQQVAIRHARRVNNLLRNEPMQLKYITGRLGYNEEWISFVNAYLQENIFQKVVIDIDATTREALLKAVQKGIEEGMGVDEITALVVGKNIERWQAARIVRTEVTRAANVGVMAAGETFEYEQSKEWIAVMDMRTRGTEPKDHANHRALDGSVIDSGDTWVDPRNGDILRFPGDPNASAASVINCRCTAALTAKRDSNGRLIPKKKKSLISVIQPGEIRRPQVITI